MTTGHVVAVTPAAGNGRRVAKGRIAGDLPQRRARPCATACAAAGSRTSRSPGSQPSTAQITSRSSRRIETGRPNHKWDIFPTEISRPRLGEQPPQVRGAPDAALGGGGQPAGSIACQYSLNRVAARSAACW